MGTPCPWDPAVTRNGDRKSTVFFPAAFLTITAQHAGVVRQVSRVASLPLSSEEQVSQ